MYFDIVEAVRQKQKKHLRGISIENGKVVVRPDVPQGFEPEEEVESSEIAPPHD